MSVRGGASRDLCCLIKRGVVTQMSLFEFCGSWSHIWRYICNVALFGHLGKEEVRPTTSMHASLLLSWRKHNLRFVTALNFQALYSQIYLLTTLTLNWMKVTEYKKDKYCDIFSKNPDINVLHINWVYMCILNVLKRNLKWLMFNGCKWK